MAKQTWVNVNGTWRKVKSVWVNVNGAWKKDVMPKGFVDGNWKEFMQYYTPTIYMFGNTQIFKITDESVESFDTPIRSVAYIDSDGEYLYLTSDTSGSVKVHKVTFEGERVWESEAIVSDYSYSRAHKSYIFGAWFSVYLIDKQTGSTYRSIRLEDNSYVGADMAVTSGSVLYAGFPRNGGYGNFAFGRYTFSGSRVWITNHFNNRLTSTQATANGDVYTISDYRHLIRYSSDGTRDWSYSLPSPQWGERSVMSLTHDKVLVGLADGTLMCFEESKTANLLWTKELTTRKIASVATMPDNTAFVLTDNSQLYKVRLDDGSVIYNRSIQSYTTTTNKNNVIVNELGHIGAFPENWDI